MSDKEIVFKSGTLLTDGKSFIFLNWVREKDWTPSNNYGTKYAEYDFSVYPRGLIVSGVYLGGWKYNLPGMWLQKGEILEHFIEIKKDLVNPVILTALESNRIGTAVS